MDQSSRKKTKRLSENIFAEAAPRKIVPLTPGTPCPWRISMTMMNEGIEIVFDLTDRMLVGRSYPETGHFDGIDLSPYYGYDHGVSRHHAYMMVYGKYVVMVDNNSANGTLINGERLKTGQMYPVWNGDTLSFGTLKSQVRLLMNPFIRN